jgi:hypothetical protein
MLQDLEKLLIHRSSKPFAEKSEHEKDELFERIAEQLALIADRLNLESPHSLKSSGPDDEKPAVTGELCGSHFVVIEVAEVYEITSLQ